MTQKSLLLALDPGLTTGWAALSPGGKIVATSVWGTDEIERSLDALIRTFFASGIQLEAVVEKMPNTGRMGDLGRKLERVRRIVYTALDTYEIPVSEIAPGEWKPSRVARQAQVPRKWGDSPVTTHQKDAIVMGWVHQEKRRRTDA